MSDCLQIVEVWIVVFIKKNLPSRDLQLLQKIVIAWIMQFVLNLLTKLWKQSVSTWSKSQLVITPINWLHNVLENFDSKFIVANGIWIYSSLNSLVGDQLLIIIVIILFFIVFIVVNLCNNLCTVKGNSINLNHLSYIKWWIKCW